MMNKSIWEHSSEYKPQFGKYNGDQETDVVIIGAGITGMTAAMLLAEAGKRVIVLEAGKAGRGTTGNSTGNLYCTVDQGLSHLKSKWGEDVLKKVVESRLSAIDMIENNCTRFNISCNFQRIPFNYYTRKGDEESLKFLRDELEAMQLCGLNAALQKNVSLPFEVAECLVLQNQAQFHPLDYVLGLAANMPASCSIYEDSPVIDIDDDGLVKTANGSVKAQAIFMATHTPKGVYMVQTVLGAYREHALAGEFNGTLPEGIYWSYDYPKTSVRTLKKGGKHYIMALGEKYKTGHGDDTTEYVDELQSLLSSSFNISGELMTWGGQQYRPADSLPYIGKQSDRLYMATGFSTDGLVYGTVAASMVTDEILGRESRWSETYKLKRFTPIKSFVEFFKINTDTFGQYLKDLPWDVDAKSSNELANGEAGVIEYEGEKIAVYNDESGTKHAVSAVCTHMKCIVNWNPAEKSWDCPCHGSRFSFDGKVIEGPALVDLPKHSLKKE